MSKVSDTKTAITSRVEAGNLESGESPEFFKSLIDLFTGKIAEALNTKLLAAEAAHNGAIDDGAVQFSNIELAIAQIETAFRQVADKPSSKTVARTGGIENVFQQITGNHEESVF